VTGLPRPLPPLRVAACLAALLVAGTLCLAQQPPPVIPDAETSTPGREATGEPPAAALSPTDVRAELPKDEETGKLTDDAGAEALISWQAPTAPPPPGKELKGYRIYRATGGGEFQGLLEPVTKPDAITKEGEAPRLGSTVSDLWTWHTYRFRVAALYGEPGDRPWYTRGQVKPEADPELGEPYWADEVLSESVSDPIRTHGKWFRVDRTNVLVGVVLFAAVVIWLIYHARAGRHIYVRPIAGMEAIDEAIGRATEMGKPILFVSGLAGLGSISTITAMTILGRVARRTAEYETPLLVPCVDPLVMLAAREIVREAYLDAGKPDAYREQDIFFMTDRQFAYVAGVDGIMLREKPAANLYMGAFFAEALILAETGSVTGAIQIAGTDSDTQIPFFVTACDYTLMGEELYAATGYLSREPMLLAQLRAQDLGKAFLGGLLALGTLAATAGALFLAFKVTGPGHWIDLALSLVEPK